MFARSTTVNAKPESIDMGIAQVRDEVLPAISEMDGCLGLSMLVDRQSGQCIVTTSWESEEAMRATAEAVRPLRDRATEMMGGVSSVQEWEIAVMHRAHASAPGSCARTTWLKSDPAGVDRALDVYRHGVLPKVQQLPGFSGASLLIDRATGLAVSSVAFDDRTALEGSRDAAQSIRSAATAELGAEILDVREHELVLAHLHVPEMA